MAPELQPAFVSKRPSALPAWSGILVIAQMITMITAVVAGPVWPGRHGSIPGGIIGGVLLVLSAAIALIGWLTLGRNLSPNPKPRPDATLVCHGIYALMRHPLYTSLMLGSLGWALLWQSLPALVAGVLHILVLDAKARVEEHWLLEQFPAYADYARRVRRFVPWIY